MKSITTKMIQCMLRLALEDLQSYLIHALNFLNMALKFHVDNS